MLRGAGVGRSDGGVDGVFDDEQKTFCDVGKVLVEIVAVLPENVCSRGRLDERLHLFFFPDCWALSS